MHYKFIKDIDLEVFVDKKSLEERGLSEEDLVAGLEIKEHREILKIFTSSHAVIPF